ncbi:MAG: hypothetical protein ACM308_07495 [Qipengyuania vulgaris]
MKKLLAPIALLALTACAVIPDTPRVGQDAAAQGTPVGIGESVWARDVILTPTAIKEDSRCPVDAVCVWQGRLTVTTRITATHWAQTAQMTLGEPYEVMGRVFVLTTATPEKRSEEAIPADAYRLTYERR